MSRTAILPCWSRLALLAVAFAAVALLLTRCSRGRAEYERRIAALRAAGEPVTAADFGALYPDPPPDKDFRRLLRLALPVGTLDPYADPSVEVGPAWDRVRALPNQAPFAPELLEQVRLELGSNAAPVELVLRTNLAGFGLVHQWQGKGFLNNSEQVGDRIFQRIRLCQTLAMQAAYEVELGNHERAATALVRRFQVARLPSRFGIMSGVGQLAGESIMLSALERTLNRAQLADDDLRRLGETLPRPRELMREILLSERALLIYWWNSPALAAWGDVSTYDKPLLNQARSLWRGYAGRLEMLDRWADRLAATRLPMREQLAAIATSESWFPQMLANRTKLASRFRPYWDADYALLLSTEPRVVSCFRDNALTQAGLANAQAAVAIERWRLAHPGRLPDTLSELVPTYLTTVPLDPFDGQPVRYKKLPVAMSCIVWAWISPTPAGTPAIAASNRASTPP
jgi:hypothetical protein